MAADRHEFDSRFELDFVHPAGAPLASLAWAMRERKAMKSFQRKAHATWRGPVESGGGAVTTESKALDQKRYAFQTRMGDSSDDTNPEELLAAAIASCFSMALSKTLTDRGTPPADLATTGTITLELRDSGPTVSTLHLSVEGSVEGADEAALRDAVEETRQSCPMYLALKPGLESISCEVAMTAR